MTNTDVSKYQHRHYNEKREKELERVGVAIDTGSLHEARTGYIQLANIEQGLANVTEASTREKHLRRRDRYRQAAAILGQLIAGDRQNLDANGIFTAASRVAREMGDRASATDRLAKILVTYVESLDQRASGPGNGAAPAASNGTSTANGTDGAADRGDTGSRNSSGGSNSSNGAESGDESDQFDVDEVSDNVVEFTTDVDETFDDVGGYPNVKATLEQQVIERVEKRHLYEAGDFSVSGGVMLVGPPGTGKTLMAKAVCGEADWSLGRVQCAEATSALFGKSAKRIQAIFDRAKEEAADQPTMLFFDEIDTLAPDRKRKTGSSSGDDRLVTAFLTEMNKLAEEDHDIIVIGASNTPDSVDSAVIDNSQRMRAVIEMPLPDVDARAEIFRVHLEAPKTSEDIDVRALAAATEGFSGSDIQAIVADAYGEVVRKTPRNANPERMDPITQTHLKAAIDEFDGGEHGGQSFL